MYFDHERAAARRKGILFISAFILAVAALVGCVAFAALLDADVDTAMNWGLAIVMFTFMAICIIEVVICVKQELAREANNYCQPRPSSRVAMPSQLPPQAPLVFLSKTMRRYEVCNVHFPSDRDHHAPGIRGSNHSCSAIRNRWPDITFCAACARPLVLLCLQCDPSGNTCANADHCTYAGDGPEPFAQFEVIPVECTIRRMAKEEFEQYKKKKILQFCTRCACTLADQQLCMECDPSGAACADPAHCEHARTPTPTLDDIIARVQKYNAVL